MVKTSAQNQLEQKVYGQINPALKNTAQGIIKTLGIIPNPQQADIDKVVASNKLDLSNPEQQKICFHYTNLQPLWATTAIAVFHGEDNSYLGNIEKRNKITKKDANDY
jgi:hypothetical protein